MKRARAMHLVLLAAVALGLASGPRAPAVRASEGPEQTQAFPNISDTWFVGGFRDNAIEIQQLGPAGELLVFWNTRRQWIDGRFEDPTSIVAYTAEGEARGRLTSAQRIEWADGTFWTRPAPTAPSAAAPVSPPQPPPPAVRAAGSQFASGSFLRFDPSTFQYRVGQLVRVCFNVPGEGRVVLSAVLPDRTNWELINDVRPAGDYCESWRPGPQDGRECIRLVFRVTMLEEKCFQVVNR